MVIMALDHVRDYFGMRVSPTNLATTTVPLFFTRWVTHICAPTFFLLTGTGACLALRTKTVPELSRFLLTRGLWLIFLEVTVVRFGLQFNVDYQITMLIVIWALGWAMITLSALVWLPVSVVTAIGLVMIAGHNLFDGVRSANPVWVMLHGQNFIVNQPGFALFVAYPIIPWVGVTAVGFGLGQIFARSPERRRAALLQIGVALSVAFVALRLANVYGDPSPWKTQTAAAMTLVSFLNVTKQPPSLLFLLMTLGPALLLLRAVDRGTPWLLRPALTFGRVPMFYFLVHFPLIHLLAVIVCYAQNGAAYWMFQSPDIANYPFRLPPGWGFSLPVVYGIWMLTVVMLYPACRWFAGVRQRRTDAWLSYL
jgi:uncharacterized membrane protein